MTVTELCNVCCSALVCGKWTLNLAWRWWWRYVTWNLWTCVCRFKSRPAVNGADPAYHASDRRARPGSAVWLAVVGPWQRDDGLGWERSRRFVYVWRRGRCQVPSQTWPGSHLSCTSGLWKLIVSHCVSYCVSCFVSYCFSRHGFVQTAVKLLKSSWWKSTFPPLPSHPLSSIPFSFFFFLPFPILSSSPS